MLVIETTTIIIKTISIPMIQNTIKVSFLNYLIFFLFQFYSIYFTGIKKKERMEPYILAQFYCFGVHYRAVSVNVKAPPSKDKKVLFSYLNESSFPNLIGLLEQSTSTL